MTAAAALAQAEAEGLTLARSCVSQSGFRNVTVHLENKARPYAASVQRDHKSVHLGCFATAEEAALHIARTPEAQAAVALPPPITADEVLAQAEAEGLTLARSSANMSGFQNVSVRPECKARPYAANVWRDGKNFHLGYFATAEEAALHIARTPEGLAALPPPMAAGEAVAQAEAEGLTLVRSSASKSGFLNVSVHPEYKARPYQARVWRDGNRTNLGFFATAEEAALHVARTPEDRLPRRPCRRQ